MITEYIVKSVLGTSLLFIFIQKVAAQPAHNLETSNKDENKKVLSYRDQYAEKMLSFMNQTVDPCDDFYEYACGNYKHVYERRQPQELPPSYLTDAEYIFNDIVEELLQSSKKEMVMNYDTELKLANQYYNTCLSADLYPMKKSQTYLELLRSIGGFPAADHAWQATADNFSWFNMSAHLNNFGASSLIKEYMGVSYNFPLFLTRPELGFDYKIKRKHSQAINSSANAVNEKRMRQLLMAYQTENANSTQIIANIFELWQTILNIEVPELWSAEALVDCEVQKHIYYAIAWNGQDMNLTDDEYCVYLQNLNAICEERKESVANYLSLQFLHHMYARLDDGKFQREMCLHKLRTGFPYLFDKLYLAKHFGADIDAEATTIITELRTSLRQLIEAAVWIDEQTRKVALLKASTILLHFSHKEEIELKESLIREMNSLAFVNDNFDANNMQLMKFKNSINRYCTLHRVQLENTTYNLDTLVAMVASAQYSQFDNSVSIFPGLLHPPAYHKAWPYALKFAGFGGFMAHELMHAFDASAVKLDQSDAIGSRWSVESYRDFSTRVQCYAEHFDGYLVPEINRTISGNATMNENIADSGGLHVSFNAYRNYIKALSAVGNSSRLLDEQMPGMNLSPEQLYFLGFAQVWCAAYEEEHYWLWLDNEHTINKYRVLGAMTNSFEFSKVYNCPLGSKMNPTTDKCRIW